MDRLIRGVHRFYRDVYLPRKDEYHASLDRQEPETLFVTCSDSRLDPQAHVQAGPGELFVLRNAGNLIPPFGTGRGGEAATIEYAVAGLGIRNIIVCGHTHCGAMKALFDLDAHANLTETTSWLRHAEVTRQIVAGRFKDMPFAEQWKMAVEQNVLSQLDHLRTHPVVAAGLAHNDLRIFGWVSDLETGRIRSFDPAVGQFVNLPGGPDDEKFELPSSIPAQMTLVRNGELRSQRTTPWERLVNQRHRASGGVAAILSDLPSSLVVFMVALPLCIAIAQASGAPAETGILTGIVGGLIVGLFSGAPLQVSGPAAGLVVLVYKVVQEFGLAGLGLAIALAGMMQFLASILKWGHWFRAVSPSVIHGMLAGIGLVIIASQVHVLVDDVPTGNPVENIRTIPAR